MIGPGIAMAADEWGIEHEQKARFEAVVVDILCELSGDCPDNCGDGKRQLGLLEDDGKLVPAVKNFDPFAGAVVDLLPFCGQRVVVDGLLIDDPAMRMFAVQFKRPAPDGEWSRANWFARDWAAAHGGNGNQWFRSDPDVRAIIEQDGVFGIPGLEPSE
jgi:hypothetical protein